MNEIITFLDRQYKKRRFSETEPVYEIIKYIRISINPNMNNEELCLVYKEWLVSNGHYFNNEMKEFTSIKLEDNIKINKNNFTNETVGISFEKFLCNIFEISNNINERRVNEALITLFTNNINKHMFSFNLKTHIGYENKSEDFICDNGKKVSVKTMCSSQLKLCPPSLGQMTRKKIISKFNLIDEKQIKPYFEDTKNLSTFINDCLSEMKKTDIYIILICKKKDDVFFLKNIDIFYNNNIDNVEIKDHTLLSLSHKELNKEWNESTTIKYNNKTIGEIQIHNNRNCIKTRFNYSFIYNNNK